MKTRNLIILASIFLFGCSEVPFVYDPKDFGNIEIKSIPKAVVDESMRGFPVEAPAHSCYRLEDNRPLPAFEKGARFFNPAYSSLCVIPLTDTSVKEFSEAYPYINEAAVKLRALLEKRPVRFLQDKDMHDLPYNNAGQSIKSKVQYIDFKTGAGVLFLTQYTQEAFPNPINNEELTYNFQGLTGDGKFYIAARFATTHPSLPKGIDFTDHIERDEEHRYLRDDEEKLNALADDSFQPSLKTLRTLLTSLKIQ